jgi:leukotriene-A4 hydrolase
MTIPVESYLLAVAVGDLAEKKIGDRTYVITEPSMLEAAATELEDLEENLIKAENYLTPYEWGEYKILILPPSFPFGGMENPLLTFASPSIIVGDKSSVDVATHEIAHSWTGNLVTNMNWNNFWLNEGFTVFTERKVTKMTEGEVAYKVAAKLGNYSMVDAMEGYGWNHSYSSLTPIMHGANPDDSYSIIPYEKGFQFVTYLESLVGEDKFQGFYREYINEFRRKSITVDDLKASFTRFVSKEFSYTEAHEILHQIDWDTWILEPGLPPVTLDFETQEFNDAVALASKYINGSVTEEDITAYEGYFVTLKGIFLSQLLQSQASLTKEIITKIDSDLKISQELNDELLYLWFQIAIASGYDQSPYSAEKEFLKSIGRLKYIQPIYQILQTVSPDTAISFYHEICEMYHPIAQDFLEKALETSKCGQSIRMETQ